MSTEQQYLTEKEAWLKIAEWFKIINRKTLKVESVNAPPHPRFLPEITYRWCDGMCVCIDELLKHNYIDLTTKDVMLYKIKLIKPSRKAERFYKWSFTKAGDKQRVQFCIDRANEL